MSFGVQQGSEDVKRIRDGISSIISDLDKNPPKVRVGLTIDDSAIAHFKSQLSSILNTVSLANGTPITINVSGLGEITTEAGRASKSLDGVAKSAQKASTSTKESAKSAKKAANEQAKAAQKAVKEEQKRIALLDQSTKLITKMKDAERNWTAAATGRSSEAYKNIQEYRAQLEMLSQQFSEGRISVETFKTKLLELGANFSKSSAQIREAGEQTKTFSERLSGLASKFSAWLSVSQIIMLAVRSLKQMVSTVIEVDTAMTELKKVTDESESTYVQFLDNASSRAKKLGATIADIVSASADFARLGYGVEEASTLADIAIMYENIGDGVNDITQATESIVSTMQAFGVLPEEAMRIVDVFNAIGNNFAISSGGIGDAMQRSAAAMKAAGNTLEETAALVAAANTVVQNPESVGTTLKTVSMFLRASKVEAEEAGESTEGMANSVSELRDQLMLLTEGRVDILTDAGNYKGTYEILRDIASVWDDIVANQGTDSAAILELIGGKRNANVVAAILENFEIAEDALRVAMESAGSAAVENEKHLDSIAGKVEIFKASFQELSTNFVDGEFVKGIIDFGTSLVGILNAITEVVNVLGGLKTVLIAVSGIVLTMKINTIVTNITDIISRIKTLTLFTGNFATKFASVYQTSRLFGASRLQSTLNGIGVGFKSIAASASTAQIAVAGVAAALVAISVVKSVIQEIESSARATRDGLISTAESSSESAQSIYSLYDAYIKASAAAKNDASAKESLQNASESLAKALGVEQDAVDGLSNSYKSLTVAELEKAIADIEIGIDSAQKNLIAEITDFKYSVEEAMMTAWGYTETGINFDTANQLEKVEMLTAAYNALYEEQIKMLNEGDTEDMRYDKISKTVALFKPYIESIQDLNNDLVDLQDLYNNVANDMVDGTSDIVADNEVVVDQLDELKNKLLELTAAYSKWREAQSGPESGDIYDDSIQALQQILDGLESGKVGTDKYKASVEFLVPEAKREDVSEYIESLKRYISEDASGVSNFISDAITAGLMIDDGSGNISIVSDATVQDFCNRLTITPDMAQAIFGELEEYGWEFNWSLDDFISPEDAAKKESELQAVQENLDGIAQSADTLSAKTIGDMGASETIVSLKEIIKWMDEIDNQQISDKHVNVYTNTISDDGGQSSANGTSSAEGGRTLVGEHGAELVVSGDRYYLVGQSGAEFVNLKRGDMVFNHTDTQKILDGRSGVRGQALRYGSVELDRGSIIDKIAIVDVNVDANGKDIRENIPYTSTKSSSSQDRKKDEESWFEKQLKEHKHLVELDKELTEDYLNWLDTAYKKAYDEGIIDLDNFYKYEEEVYKGRQDLFKDHLNDINHEISILEAGIGNSDEIIKLSQQALEDIEKELAAAREAGLDENGDYIQYLEKQWQDYSQSVIDLREDAETEAKRAIDELVDYRVDMLKKDIENEKDALDKKLSDLQEFYDKQREMLQDQYDEEKYLEEQSEKRKSVTDIKSELAMLGNDDSAWAQKRKLELQKELVDAEKELNSFERDHALDMTLDLLDEQQAAAEAQIQAEMDALDEKLNDPHALFNQALEDIKNNTADLYQEFIDYNRKYGDGRDSTIDDLWEEAYKADLEYQDTHGGAHPDGVVIGNYTGYEEPSNPTPSTPPSSKPADKPDTKPKEEKKPSLKKGDSIQVKKTATHFSSKSGGSRMASYVPGGTYTVYKTSGSEVLIGRDGVYTGWINKSDIVGYRLGTNYSIGGLAQWDEDGRGSEYIFESSDGNRYRMFAEGSKVLNSDATNFLYEFATSGGEILSKMLTDIFGLSNFSNIVKPVQAIDIHTGNIIVQGNATERTVSEIRRAQRDSLEFVIKEFNKLNK